MLMTRKVHKKGGEVSVKAGSPPASLSFGGRATKRTTVEWSIPQKKQKNQCLRAEDLSWPRYCLPSSKRDNEQKLNC